MNNLKIEVSESNGDLLLYRNQPQSQIHDFENHAMRYLGKADVKFEENGEVVTKNGELLVFKGTENTDLVKAASDFIVKLSEAENISLFNALNESKDVFGLRTALSYEEIEGYFGEFLFLYKLLKDGKNVTRNYHDDNKDLNDLYFDGFTLEIKTNSTGRPMFDVSQRQLTETENLRYLIWVKLVKANNGHNVFIENSINLVDLIEKIKSLANLSDVNSSLPLMAKFDELENMAKDSSLMRDTRFEFSIDDDRFCAFEGGVVPKLSSESSDRISFIHYKIDMSGVKFNSIQDVENNLGE